jgi:hypothetical protein
MMARRAAWLGLVVAGLLSESALAQDSSIPANSVATEPDAAVKALADSCSARKFEIVVPVAPGRGSKVKICGQPGQTDAQWLVTLKDSMAKTEANTAMAPAVREKILAAIGAEVARLESEAAAARPSTAENATIDLPSLPVAPRESDPQYSKLPPLPAPTRPAPANLAGGATAASTAQEAEPPVRPNLTMRCGLPGETFDSCAKLREKTQLLVRVGEDIAAGTVMRFVRDGDMRDEIELGALKRGAALRYKLPGRICRGVFRGKVEVQLVTKGRVAETLGPYSLDCRP